MFLGVSNIILPAASVPTILDLFNTYLFPLESLLVVDPVVPEPPFPPQFVHTPLDGQLGQLGHTGGTICVFNNNQHGMVAQFQEENMNSRFVGTRAGYSNPNFRLLANSYGIENYAIVKDLKDLEKLERICADFSSGPALIEVIIENSAKALPKMSHKSE
jgi:hypothetical protein